MIEFVGITNVVEANDNIYSLATATVRIGM